MSAIASSILILSALCFSVFFRVPVEQESQKSYGISSGAVILHKSRSSAGDLELSGEIAGLPPDSVRYLRYEDLLRLPQETYTVSADDNFRQRTVIGGVALSTLARMFGRRDKSDMVAAVCYDRYQSNYPSEYMRAHHPILVLKIDGKLRDQWPLSEYGGSLGPYLISHPTFTPSYTVLSHKDEAQIPFGVTGIVFDAEALVFGAIRPPGKWPENSAVWQGYRIAREDCYRCHNMGTEGGHKAERSWLILAAWAATNPSQFESYIHAPKSIMPSAVMPAHPEYDKATLAALTAYFRTFEPTRQAQ